MSFVRWSVVDPDAVQDADDLIAASSDDPGTFARVRAPFRLAPRWFTCRQECGWGVLEGAQSNLLEDFPIVSSKYFDVQSRPPPARLGSTAETVSVLALQAAPAIAR
ncbi:hypothetical protein [Kribbella voronezhensis]|uniref:hypothetical protein n=1 Tax=Kribbella voronezhensis TaxID=2512212 RepID=UPI001EDE2337|nr:hypothetical protein [Kribbella voronezhensis]